MDSKIYIYLAIGIVYYVFKFYKKSKEKNSNDATIEQIPINPKPKFHRENLKAIEKEENTIENTATYEIETTKPQVESVNKLSNNNKTKSSQQLTDKLKSLPELKRAFIYSEIFKTKF